MKGICFKEALFNAVIDGRKTQTRLMVRFKHRHVLNLGSHNGKWYADGEEIKFRYKLGIRPFAMGYMDFETGKKTQAVKDICRWVNCRRIFNVQKDFSKYKKKV